MAIFAIIADGQFDQFVESEEQRKQECKDLRDMGCEVRSKFFLSWEDAEEWESKLRR